MQFDSNVSSSAGGDSQERPILFNAPMVRAILTGAKTHTRRAAIKCSTPGRVVACDFDAEECLLELENTFNGTRSWQACPYGKPGDRLWVREAWAAPHAFDHLPPRLIPADARFHYAASGSLGGLLGRPSIHMPRWASRLTLEITGVRVERLQDISETDAIAEGVAYDPGEGGTFHVPGVGGCAADSAAGAFRKLWEQINGAESWAANLWVWVVEFKMLEAV